MNILNEIRKNLSLITATIVLVYAWASLQMGMGTITAQVESHRIEIDFIKSRSYTTDNKITELSVELRNMNKNIEVILEEMRSRR